jgi:hypothetical protein
VINIKHPDKWRTITIESIRELPPNIGGVYALKDRFDNVIYVGKSVQFRSRLATHARGYGRSGLFINHVVKADLYRIDSDFEREIYETYLINYYAPKYNIAKVYDDVDEATAKVKYEIERMEARQYELEERRQEIIEHFFEEEGEKAEDETLDDHDLDYEESRRLGEDLRGVIDLGEIETELKTIADRLRYYYKKL